VVLSLLRTPLRFIGALLVGGAIALMLRAPQPDVLVSGDGTAFAVRGADGRLSMIKSGSDGFALREWLAADGDARAVKDETLANGIGCDASGCIGRLRDGSLVAFVKSIDAFEEDCRRAALVVSARDAPADCAAPVVDRQVLRRAGALALQRVGQGFAITPSRPAGYQRPWAPGFDQSGEASEMVRSTAARSPARDATPRLDDLEAGD
jgi:competence protein ComEC